jgi:hypothetical protein
VLAASRLTLGDVHPTTLASAANLGALLLERGSRARLDEGAPLVCEALAGRRAVLGDAHPETYAAAALLAVMLRAQSDDSVRSA